MAISHKAQTPFPTASALAPVLFAAGDPDFLLEMLSSHPLGVLLVEAGPRLPLVYFNESFERSAALAGRSILGTSLLDLFEPGDRSGVRAACREAILTGRPRLWRPAPAGRTERSLSLYPVCGQAGAVTHVLGLSAAATGQAAASARIRRAQQRTVGALTAIAEHLQGSSDLPAFLGRLTATTADLVAASKAAFWRYDPDTQTLSLQPETYGIDERAAAAANGVPCAPDGKGLVERIVFGDLVLVDDVSPDNPRYAPYRLQVEALGIRDTISVPWKIGQRRLGVLGVYGSTQPAGFTDEDVWVLQVAATAAAIVWEHKQADDALADLREREASGLRQQIEQSLQLEKLKTNFLKLASHELRGPLGILRGYVSMMEDGSLDPDEVAPVLPVLRAKLDEMNRLIDEILDTARLEDRALELKPERIDLCELAVDAVRALEPLATPRHRLVTAQASQPVVVQGDRARLRMVVSNLVHNAIKYSPEGGDVRIGCGSDGDEARVTVSDQGVGIAGSDQDRLFTRFGRIVTERTSHIAGTGLGLYLARDLARRHGGDVEVESAPGRGSTFTLRLPLAQA